MPTILKDLKETSKEFREEFLITFTKELIKNSVSIELKEAIEQREREELMELKEIYPQIATPSQPIKEISSGIAKPGFKALPKPFKIPPRLRIPTPRLPPRLQYIQPQAKQGVEIELGKLNPLVTDPVIQTIECNGPNERIIVRDPVQKATNITLTKEEIDSVIKAFADTARIPVTEGIFRVAAGKLLLSAITSEVIGSKFIIKKLRYSPLGQAPQRTNLSFLKGPVIR